MRSLYLHTHVVDRQWLRQMDRTRLQWHRYADNRWNLHYSQ